MTLSHCVILFFGRITQGLIYLIFVLQRFYFNWAYWLISIVFPSIFLFDEGSMSTLINRSFTSTLIVQPCKPLHCVCSGDQQSSEHSIYWEYIQKHSLLKLEFLNSYEVRKIKTLAFVLNFPPFISDISFNARKKFWVFNNIMYLPQVESYVIVHQGSTKKKKKKIWSSGKGLSQWRMFTVCHFWVEKKFNIKLQPLGYIYMCI